MQRDSQTDVAFEADAEERGRPANPAPGSYTAEDAEEAGEPEFDPEDFEPRPFTPPDRRRVAMVLVVLLVILCAAVVPPLISANRFRGQIAGSISASIGRPVHMDAVTLNILPWPGFTLENFVVSEDPRFGTEPVVYAKTVRARLRLRSLWRRPVEFSRITLDEPSVNLVHGADGRWNVESILLQASKMDAAPTAQSAAGRSPRFPYIEASGARVNVKVGLEKMPISLTEADFSLWLPEPREWRLRLEGHPARTDTAASDTGTFSMEGRLGKASTLAAVPVDLTAEWKSAPLGAVSWVLMGRDAGFRGELNLRASITGTMGRNLIDSRLELTNLRRAEFVPARMLDMELECRGSATRLLHQVDDLRCVSPMDADKPGLVITGQVPELLNPATATGVATLKNLPLQGLLDVLRLVTPRVAPELTLAGKLTGALTFAGAADVSGSLVTSDAQLALDDAPPFVDGGVAAEIAPAEVILRPIGLRLGAAAPAALDAHLNSLGLTMHLSGAVTRARVLQLAAALPLFGDGLAEALPPPATAPGGSDATEPAMRVDLVSSRPWGGAQSWTAVTPAKPSVRRKAGRR